MFLTLYLWQWKEVIQTPFGEADVYPLKIESPQGFSYFANCPDFTNVVGVKILLMKEGGHKELPLTPGLHHALIEFLHHYRVQRDFFFDCCDFVNLAYDVPPHNRLEMDEWWQVEPYRERPEAGDVVFLVKHEEDLGFHFFHAAIYLGFDRYLSVYGQSGELMVASLRDMMRFHQRQGADLIVRVVLKGQKNKK